jgi:hypothetical protein
MEEARPLHTYICSGFFVSALWVFEKVGMVSGKTELFQNPIPHLPLLPAT